MRKIIPFLTVLYPIMIFAFRQSTLLKPLAFGLGSFLIVEMIVRQPFIGQLLSGLGVALIIAIMHIFEIENTVRLYPFFLSLSMLLVFSLSRDPQKNPMIGPFREKAARDPQWVQAMHEARWIWIVGLSINTTILGVFLFAFPLTHWLLYASVYSYLLLGSLFLFSLIYVLIRMRQGKEC